MEEKNEPKGPSTGLRTGSPGVVNLKEVTVAAVEQMNRDPLRELCAQLQISKSGSKGEMIARIKKAMKVKQRFQPGQMLCEECNERVQVLRTDRIKHRNGSQTVRRWLKCYGFRRHGFWHTELIPAPAPTVAEVK